MADETIGTVRRINLQIYQDTELSFDVEWWETINYTSPINISASATLIKLDGVEYNLEDLGMATVDDNVIHVELPPEWTAALPAIGGTWSCTATDAVSGEERKLARGLVKVSE